jgi:hypothetical protein
MATLAQRLQDLATAIGTDVKTLRTFLTGSSSGDLTGLNTTAKNSIIAALNEVRAQAIAAASTGGATINDAAAATGTVYSGQHVEDRITAAIQALTGANVPAALDTLAELAAQLQSDESASAALTTAVGLRVRVDAAQAFTAPQKLQARTNIGADVTSTETGDLNQDLVAAYNTAKA